MTFDELIKAVRENEARDLALTQVCGQEGKPGEITFTTYWERVPGVEFHVAIFLFIYSLLYFDYFKGIISDLVSWTTTCRRAERAFRK